MLEKFSFENCISGGIKRLELQYSFSYKGNWLNGTLSVIEYPGKPVTYTVDNAGYIKE